ncbi:glycosyltransferase family 2 protein [Acidithiobacillus thiooxidans]|uniref:glycosyltransferase family 2 protein n=1 Tax=Acidithiobacillus thiooxidans TaxID=930 RepID=UPI000ADE828B|nr:glycosyltransferase family 2 protein [Acidithiobacillus thiooxidans]
MTVSIIVPCHNESGNLKILYERVSGIMDACGEPWGMVCVNDGSIDDTLLQLIELHQQDSRIQVIDLSRNFGKEAALTAGLDAARGDAAIPLDADLQDPPELIPELLAQWRDGYDVVNAVRLSREGESWLKRASAHFFTG